MLHWKTLKTQKIFFPTTSSIFAILWGVFGTLRRVLSIIVFFLPCFGLFDILYHWHAEQYPFTIRPGYHPLPIDTIQLYNVTVGRWKELDRWTYEIGDEPIPPPYSLYTGFNLQNTTIMFLIIMVFHCISMAIVKYFTSVEFSRKGNYFRKFIHVLQNLNISYPFVDWDEGMFNLDEYRRRYTYTKKEMTCSFAMNMLFSWIMIMPLWYTGRYVNINTY